VDAEIDLLVGSVLADRYRVLGPLGSGGMGKVYRVEHLTLHKEMACKLLHPELSRLDEVSRRFEREAEAAARLDHPHIVSVTDFGRTSDGQLFLVMELLEGPSLAEVLRPTGGDATPMSAARALPIFRQILKALGAAHEAQIVHRDLKPENIVLVVRDGQPDFVKIIDFGIAKLDSKTDSGAPLTQAGVVFGTPEYLSPEQALGEEADLRADLYAAGVMLYEMLTGHRPFEAESRVQILSMHLTKQASLMRTIAPAAAIPRGLEPVVRRAMEKQRADRYPDAKAFLQALDGLDVTSTPSPVELVRRTAQRVAVSGWTRARGTWPYLIERARLAGIAQPRAAAGGVLLIVAAMAILGLTLLLRRGPATPALSVMVDRAELLLARGEMEPARAALQQLLMHHPELARVHYLMGNLNYADGQRDRAIGDYDRALKIEPTYKQDRVLRENIRMLLERRIEAGRALGLLIDDIGADALPEIVSCARSCKEDRVRKRAVDAALRLGGPDALGSDGKPDAKTDAKADGKTDAAKADNDPDPLKDALTRLVSGRGCKDRKRAALELIATNDTRYLDALEKARTRRGGFFNAQQINVCMKKDLDEAIAALRAAK